MSFSSAAVAGCFATREKACCSRSGRVLASSDAL
jgi:hypothetical protein